MAQDWRATHEAWFKYGRFNSHIIYASIAPVIETRMCDDGMWQARIQGYPDVVVTMPTLCAAILKLIETRLVEE